MNCWNEKFNPICKFLRDFSDSKTNNRISITSPKFLRYTLSDYYLYFIDKGLKKDNKSYIKLNLYFENSNDFNFINAKWINIARHGKDYLVSYENINDIMHVSILNSLNTHSGSTHYQTNHILIIKEYNNNSNLWNFFYNYL